MTNTETHTAHRPFHDLFHQYAQAAGNGADLRSCGTDELERLTMSALQVEHQVTDGLRAINKLTGLLASEGVTLDARSLADLAFLQEGLVDQVTACQEIREVAEARLADRDAA